jgi:hypothetical protein
MSDADACLENPATADCADGVTAISSVSASNGTARIEDFFIGAGEVIKLLMPVLPGTYRQDGIIERTDAGACAAIHELDEFVREE